MSFSQELSNGYQIPIVGFGTYDPSYSADMEQAALTALRSGYRHLDCASLYQNEDQVGRAIQTFLAETTTHKREDLFITTKLSPFEYSPPSSIEQTLRRQLSLLQLTYVDLYLLHWPMGLKLRDPAAPLRLQHAVFDPQPNFLCLWKEMEALVEAGLTKSIGVSNFNPDEIRRLYAAATIKPVVNQIELHPLLPQDELTKVHEELGIVTESYLALRFISSQKTPPEAISALKKIADDAGLSIADLCLIWNAQRGHVVLIKSVTPERIVSNLAVFDKKLSEDTMKQMNACSKTYGPLRLNNHLLRENDTPVFPN